MTRFYLAARYSKRALMRRYRKQLQRLGHSVSSRWLDGDPGETSINAVRDLVDVAEAQACILFVEKPRTPTRGGRWFELGYSAGLNKELILVGTERENIFCRLPDAQRYDTWRQFITALKRRPSLRHTWAPGIAIPMEGP